MGISTKKSVDMAVDMDGKFNIHGNPDNIKLNSICINLQFAQQIKNLKNLKFGLRRKA